MRLFPKRSREEKVSEVKQWGWIAVFCGAICLAGIGLIFGLEWVDDRFGQKAYGLSAIGLLMIVLGGFLFVQSLFHVVIEATVGPERFVAFFIGFLIFAGIAALLSGPF